MKKRLFAIIMSIAMTVAFIPTSMVFAAGEPFTVNGVGYSTLQDAVNACPDDGTETTIYMNASTYELNAQIDFKEDQNIVLTSAEGNIGEIKRESGYLKKLFEIDEPMELTFDKIIINGDSATDPTHEVLVVEGANDKPISGVKVNFGKTVSGSEYPILKSNKLRLFYNLGGEVTMNSGTITGCGCRLGHGAFHMLNGKLTIYGGTLKNNTAPVIDMGGNVEVNIAGGSITDNICNTALILNTGATLNITGGSMTDNDACVVSNNGTFTMTGGSMTNNSINNCVVSNSGTFTMTGGSINNNPALGVYNFGDFIMSGGEIKGNANTLTDDPAWGNMAGGVCNLNDNGTGGKGSPAGTVTLSGNAVIKDNTKGTGSDKKTSNVNMVYTQDGETYIHKINVTGEMSPNAYVGVDTVNNEPGDQFAVNTSSSRLANAAAFKNDNKPGVAGKQGDADDEIVWGEAAPDPEPPAPTPAVETDKTIPAKVKTGNRQVTISWNKVDGAAYYDIYGAPCGKQVKKLATVSAGKTLEYTQKKLKNRKTYKYIVKARGENNGQIVTVGKTLTCHVAMSKHSRTNAKAVKVNKKSVSLKANGTFKVKAKTVKQKKNKKLLKHGKLYRYYSSDNEIASVSSKGKITAKKAGTCKVYVVAGSGVYKTINVTVR